MLSAAGEDEHPTDDKRGNICFFELTPGGNRVESFETYQPYLFSIAYRMLGSAMDAEDMVQETYIRSGYQSRSSPERLPKQSIPKSVSRQRSRSHWRSWSCWSNSNRSSERSSCCAKSSRTSLLRLLPCLRRVKPPVAAPSAGRSNTWSTGGHASHQLLKRTGNCSPAFWQQCGAEK